MGQPGVVANPTRGQLNREFDLFRSRLSIWSREMDSAVQSRLSCSFSTPRLNHQSIILLVLILYTGFLKISGTVR